MNKQQEPRLRFKGFTGGWEEKRLSDVVEIVGGGTPDTNNSAYWGGEIDWYSPTEIGENVYANGSIRKITLLGLQKSSAVILPADRTVLFTSRASIGDMAILTKQGATNQGFQSFIVREGLNIYFLYTMGFKIKEYALKNASGSTFLEISKTQLLQMESLFPSLPEQTHLGLFFRRLDSQIAESRAVLEKSRQLKKAMLSKMFPANGEKIPKIRFKGFEGEWERKKLGEIAFKVKEKNIAYQYAETFTNSAEFGIISQQDFFDKSISNSENIGGYYVVQPNDFVYNPRISSFAPVGPIKRNKLGRTGVMSPLYYVFRLNDEIKPSYLEQYFEGNQWHHFMYLNGDTGARSDRFSIKNDVFAEMPISFPADKNEQTAIGNFFRQLDETIALQSAEVEKLNQLKKGLLAAMLV